MLTAMEATQSTTTTTATGDPVTEFLVTGRTGRRNAMPDILGPNITTSSGDLPDRLQTLTTQDDSDVTASNAPGNSSTTTGTTASASQDSLPPPPNS